MATSTTAWLCLITGRNAVVFGAWHHGGDLRGAKTGHPRPLSQSHCPSLWDGGTRRMMPRCCVEPIVRRHFALIGPILSRQKPFLYCLCLSRPATLLLTRRIAATSLTVCSSANKAAARVSIGGSKSRFVHASPAAPFSETNGFAVASNGAPTRPMPNLLIVNFKPRPLLRRIVFRSSQPDHGVQHIFAPRLSPLATIVVSVMDKQNRLSGPPQFQQPVLHWLPSITCILATVGEQGR
jgi:hypothetical protein